MVDEHSIKASHTTVKHILATKGYTKVCRRYVPKQLNDKNKQVRVDAAWKFLVQHAHDLMMISHM